MNKCYFCNKELIWTHAQGLCKNHEDTIHHFYNFDIDKIDYVSFNAYYKNNTIGAFISLEEKKIHFEGRNLKFRVSIELNDINSISIQKINSILNKIMKNKAFI